MDKLPTLLYCQFGLIFLCFNSPRFQHCLLTVFFSHRFSGRFRSEHIAGCFRTIIFLCVLEGPWPSLNTKFLTLLSKVLSNIFQSSPDILKPCTYSRCQGQQNNPKHQWNSLVFDSPLLWKLNFVVSKQQWCTVPKWSDLVIRRIAVKACSGVFWLLSCTYASLSSGVYLGLQTYYPFIGLAIDGESLCLKVNSNLCASWRSFSTIWSILLWNLPLMAKSCDVDYCSVGLNLLDTISNTENKSIKVFEDQIADCHAWHLLAWYLIHFTCSLYATQ